MKKKHTVCVIIFCSVDIQRYYREKSEGEDCYYFAHIEAEYRVYKNLRRSMQGVQKPEKVKKEWIIQRMIKRNVFKDFQQVQKH